MARFATTPEIVESVGKFRDEILEQTTELDISIRRQALNLLSPRGAVLLNC